MPHTASWFVVIFHPPQLRHIFKLQSSKLDIVYDARYWKLADSVGNCDSLDNWVNELTNSSKWLSVDALRHAAPRGTTKGHSFYIYSRHWSVRNIDDPGQKLACLSKQNSANARSFFPCFLFPSLPPFHPVQCSEPLITEAEIVTERAQSPETLNHCQAKFKLRTSATFSHWCTKMLRGYASYLLNWSEISCFFLLPLGNYTSCICQRI